MHLPPKAIHSATSSRDHISAHARFLSEDPNVGHGKLHPVHREGFEAIPGYRIRERERKAPRYRNVTELTYGPRTFNVQTGESAPTQTQVADTTLYPWRANAMLQITVPGKEDVFLGSGWFIGPYALITAAHVVYPREPGVYSGWASQIEVIPGLNGSSNTPPFGAFSSNEFYCPDGWQSDGDPRLDYGVILLGQGVGSQVGTYGYATYPDADLLATVANVAGYPENKPNGTPALGTQWYDAGNVANVDDSFVYYYLETQVGQSGSCVYRNIGEQRYAMAIHTAAADSQDGLDRGLRIIEPVFENLQRWAGMHG